LFQGWAADFIPKIVSEARDAKYIDEIMHPGGHDAIRTAQELAVKEGIFSGISGGGVLASAIEIAKMAPEGSSILAMIPDTGERYLSTPLFANIPAEVMIWSLQYCEFCWTLTTMAIHSSFFPSG
jgi:cysteine synthase A